MPIIYDTTLREGFQTPGGVGASLDERMYIAKMIAQHRYADWIELGMPANAVDKEVIRHISGALKDVGIGVLARATASDIDAAADVMAGHPNSLCHIFIGTSDEHRAVRFGGKRTKREYCDGIEACVSRARAKDFSRVMFSREDAMRTFTQDSGFFYDVIDAARKGHGTGRLIVNLPDTTGVATTGEFIQMLRAVQKRYRADIDVSIHSHNDSGHSVSHAIEAYQHGVASWIQTCFGGIGERNGISSTESVLTQFDERGVRVLSDRKNLVPVTNSILAAMGRVINDVTPIAGPYTNITASGIHADLTSKNSAAYHSRGCTYGAIPVSEFGPTSGAGQVVDALAKIGVIKSKEQVAAFTNVLKQRSNMQKSAVSESEIMSTYLIDEGSAYPLRVTNPRISVGEESVLSMYVSNDEKSREIIRKGGADYRLIVDALCDVSAEMGHMLSFGDLTVRVVPCVPKRFISSGSPVTALDLDSRLCATTTLYSSQLPFAVRSTFVSEHSMYAMMMSAIHATQDAVLIGRYLRK
ncbi:MAG TPA: hypothetical protein VK158_03960 [Acidobacteriota bacterium]|nr:hypothetical protein [Acidobacteriota bacterium]